MLQAYINIFVLFYGYLSATSTSRALRCSLEQNFRQNKPNFLTLSVVARTSDFVKLLQFSSKSYLEEICASENACKVGFYVGVT